jgi:outer membrane protein assembly factor BamB
MSADTRMTERWSRVALAMAATACVFSLVVGTLLIANLAAMRTVSPVNLPEMDRLRVALKANPGSEALQIRIRDLDVVSRRFYLGGLASNRSGGFLLLGGLVVTLASLHAWASLRRRRPDPRAYAAAPDPLRSEATARLVVGGMAVLLIGGAIAVGLFGRPVPREAPVATGSAGAKRSPVTAVSVPAAETDPAAWARNWPGFRGPTGGGTSAFTNAPLTWDGVTGKGIQWKVNVPLPGMSSPVIWSNRVFVTGAVATNREVYCFDMATGTMLWRVGVDAAPGNTNRVPTVYSDTGYAASTVVTDGRNVYAIFANGDLVAIDHCANKLWEIDLGVPENQYGYAASLVLARNRVIVQFDQAGEKGQVSELLAFDTATGKKAWSVRRPVAESWPTPLVIATRTGEQIVTVANDWIIGYDADGAELWKVACGGSDVASSPIFAGGLVLAPISNDKVYAVKPDGRGDVTETHLAWKSDDGVSDVPSPVSDGTLVYFIRSGGALTCLEVATGKVVWDKNLEGEFYASPVLAGEVLYVTARNGEVFILKAGPKYEEVGKANLGETSDCSPALADGRIILRGARNLFCVGPTHE